MQKSSGTNSPQILQSKIVYSGKVVHLNVEQVIEPGGVLARREVVVHPGAVVLIPRFSDGSILLVRQYRHAARQRLWELVAGTLEPNESPRRGANRELQEETGYRAKHLRPVLDFFPSPGVLSERMYIFEARGLQRGQSNPDPDERLVVRRFTIKELRSMLKQRQFRDGKTLVGLLWLLGSPDARG